MLAILDEYRRHFVAFDRSVKLLLLSLAVFSVGSGIFGLLLNIYLIAAGYSATVVATAAAISSFAAGVLMVPAGLLCDRISRRTAIIWGAIFWTLNFGLVLVAQTAVAIYVAMLVGSVAGAILTVAETAYLADRSSSEERVHLFSVLMMIFTVVGVIGTLAGGYLPRLFAAWFRVAPDNAAAYRGSIAVAFALGIVATVIRFFLADSRPVAPSYRGISLHRSKHFREIVKFTVAATLVGAAAGLFVPFFNVFFKEKVGLSTSTVGNIFSIQSAFVMIGLILGPSLGRLRGRVMAATVIQSAAIPLLFILAWSHQVFLLELAFWLRGTFMIMAGPLWDSFSFDIVDQGERATLTSVQAMGRNMGWGISSQLAGVFMSRGDYSTPFLIASVLYAAAFAHFYFSLRGTERTLAAKSLGAEG